MLLANRMVASFLRKKDVHDHNVYRVHDLPDEEKSLNLFDLLENLILIYLINHLVSSD